MILALDIALTTGWAVSSQAGPVCGTVRLKHGRGVQYHCPGLNLWVWLDQMYQVWGFARVVQESPFVHPKRPNTVAVPMGLQMTCQGWCEHKGIPWSEVAPKSIKKHATGNGNANKVMMLEAARARWPEVSTHDEADAMWLLDMVLSKGGWQ